MSIELIYQHSKYACSLMVLSSMHALSWYCQSMRALSWYYQSMCALSWYCQSMRALSWYCQSMRALSWYYQSMRALSWYCQSMHALSWYCQSMHAFSWYSAYFELTTHQSNSLGSQVALSQTQLASYCLMFWCISSPLGLCLWQLSTALLSCVAPWGKELGLGSVCFVDLTLEGQSSLDYSCDS